MICTTLNRIRAHSPCAEGWEKLLRHLGKTTADDEPLAYSVIVESNGLGDALWCCRAEPEREKEWRLFAVWCARQVQHLMHDERSVNAMDVAESYAKGNSTEEKLAAARVSAWVSARDAAMASAWASARDAAWASAWASAMDAQKAEFLRICRED